MPTGVSSGNYRHDLLQQTIPDTRCGIWKSLVADGWQLHMMDH